MPHGQGYQQQTTLASQQFEDELQTRANMQFYAQDIPKLYFRPACYQAGGWPPPGYHMTSYYREYRGQPQETAHALILIPASLVHQPAMQNEDWTSKIADVIQNHFGLKPKD
jgi:hypothetical protein